MEKMLHINPKDNVAVALAPVEAGETFSFGGVPVTALEDIPQGHKMALADLTEGSRIMKYGFPIGHVTADVKKGGWLHTHNIKTDLSEESDYVYRPDVRPLAPAPVETFSGYRWEDGRVGIRNELWIIPTVGCVNDVSETMVRQNQSLVEEFGLDGLYCFQHPYGCSQMGDDHATTRKILADLVRHPNAGAVLVVGLGCENITMEQFRTELGQWNDSRVKFMICQEYEDELEAGGAFLRELAGYAGQFKREPLPVSELVVGMKCGGSDGLSGITANPTVGAFSDLLVAQGGSVMLTEVPEMFGAEEALLNRCVDKDVFGRAVDMINSFKNYFTSHNQVVYENPSPGNKQGGITTLEDKSLGCVQKGGTAPVVDVLQYGEPVRKRGLSLLSAPGNDLVSATALTASGCHIVLFTTGRGTPFSAPAPTVKISSNNALYEKKANWIDFNAGTVVEGETIAQAGRRLMDFVKELASGERLTKAEENNYRGIAIFKDGVTL